MVTGDWLKRIWSTPIRDENYSDIIMSAMEYHITDISMIYSILCSGTDLKKTLKLRVTGLCEGNSPNTGEFLSQRASKAENISISQTQHEIRLYWYWLLWNKSKFQDWRQYIRSSLKLEIILWHYLIDVCLSRVLEQMRTCWQKSSSLAPVWSCTELSRLMTGVSIMTSITKTSQWARCCLK